MASPEIALVYIEEPSEEFPHGAECPTHHRVHSQHGWHVCLPESHPMAHLVASQPLPSPPPAPEPEMTFTLDEEPTPEAPMIDLTPIATATTHDIKREFTTGPTVSDVDLINHPPHYSAHPSGVECITITETMGFNVGNAVKYLWRADEKGNALEDLRKAEWYIKREIARRSA